jgi:methylmalonyl-CoA/ethylmalonyl-CoA epimerase
VVLTPFAGLIPVQLAFVTSDLERAVRQFDALLGAGPWQGHVFDADTVEGREYRGEPADWSFRLVVNDREPQFEIIESVAGPNIFADWLDARGEGFHHVGYEVTSVDETTAEMTQLGHPAILRGHSFGAARDGVCAFYDTADSLGFIIEACEPAGSLPEPAFRLGASG